VRLLLVPLVLVALVACGTPAPTATPPFARYTPAQVLDAFAGAGLPVTDAAPGKPWKQGDLWPNVAAERLVFTIPAIAPQGGVVQTFATAENLAAMRAYYVRVPDQAPYVYAHGNALVQLDNGLPPAEADRYRAALEAMR
jgi:hypothetical protein